MKILILEDDQNRISHFIEVLGDDHNLVISKDVDEAYAFLKEHNDVEVIMFDNDLGEGGEGRQLAQLILRDFYTENEEYISKLRMTIVHSMNTVANAYIYDVMEAITPITMRVPFGEILKMDDFLSTVFDSFEVKA